MKILFDASELTPDTAKSIGIYRYALGLAQSMAAQLADHEQMLLVCNGANRSDFERVARQQAVTLICVQPGMPGHVWRQWWMRLGCALFARRHGVSVYLSPKGFVPRPMAWSRAIKRVCVMHDLIPFWYAQRMPGYFGRLEMALVTAAFRNAWSQADRIVAISSDTRSALLNQGVTQGKVVLVPNGVDPVGERRTPARPVGLDGRFIFAMASKLPHKNQQGVLAAYAAYRQRVGAKALPLALCGADDVQQDGVLALGRVSDEVLGALYAHADLFVFLSLIEGFGYPPIEALRAGTPVVCSTLDVFREVCGDMARYASPEDALAVAEEMAAATQQPWSDADRAALRDAAVRRIDQGLQWAQCAAGVLEVIRQVVPCEARTQEAA